MPIVSCYLMGGLGNQLFQIFTTIAYGIRSKRKIIFPYSKKLNLSNIRYTYWDTFLSSLKTMTSSSEDLLHLVQYRETTHHYNEIPMLQNDEFLLFGYFQSYKYFESEKETIFSLIRLSESRKKVVDEFSEYFPENKCVVSMHFRLGDYKNFLNSHPIMPYTYYDTALMHILMNSNTNDPINVLYFCEKEDNDVVSSMIQQFSNFYTGFKFIKVDDHIEDWKQMLLMSNCHHHIIANSSFSWWGAYFSKDNLGFEKLPSSVSKSSDKIVCYPSLWFGPALSDKIVDDMFPNEWKKIDVRPV